MRIHAIVMLEETLQIVKDGRYAVKDKNVTLKLSEQERKESIVLLPKDVYEIGNQWESENAFLEEICQFRCENMDSFTMARKRSKEMGEYHKDRSKPVLVLNFANPVNPGGGVRQGALAQEEDLCRKSTLLLSLESDKAKAYYEYHRRLHTNMGSDAMIFTPQVEILRDEKGNLLDETEIVAVLTCAAPMLLKGREGMSEEEYQGMVYRRIVGMLKAAAHFGYTHLVLGAWGCGAFGNDAEVMSDLFYRALHEVQANGRALRECFCKIDFAVLSRSAAQYNFKQFSRNFSKSR